MNNQNQLTGHNHSQVYAKHEEYNPNGGGLPPQAEAERIRHRFDGLRKHHNESADIYNRTQPIINEQIHNETIKYLKNGQVNGTKTKSQKPRAPKRQRTATNSTNNTNIIPNNVPTSNNSFNNAMITQPAPVNPGTMQQQHTQHMNIYPPRIQQPMQAQHPPHVLHSQGISTHHQRTHLPQQQSFHQQQQHVPSYNHQQQNPPQHQMYQQHFQPMQPSTIQNNHHQPYYHNNLNHNPIPSLPNDLDLNLQAGLECDVESLINHEISVEGQLDFNHELLFKLDNHYRPPQHNYQ